MLQFGRRKVLAILVVLCLLVLAVPVSIGVVNNAFTAPTGNDDDYLSSESQEIIPESEFSTRDLRNGSETGDSEHAGGSITEPTTVLPDESSSSSGDQPVPSPSAPKEAKRPYVSPKAVISMGIPTSATVLVLPGADLHTRDDTQYALQGFFSKSPYVTQVVDYPRNLTLDSIPTGVKNIDKAIRSTQGTIIVMAYSQGAQVASEWMRKYAKDPNVPGAKRLMFVLFGNPLRASGGSKVGNPTKRTTGLATPTDTPWRIVDVARRYDGFADSPNDKSNTDAVKNANRGKFVIHPRYENVDIFAKSNTVWKRGNTMFVLTYEASLPIYSDEEVSSEQIRTMRAKIESAYDRR